MRTHDDSRRSIAAWLETEAPDRAPARLIENSRARIRATPQRLAWWPTRRGSHRNTFGKLGLIAAAVAAISVVGLTVLRPPPVGPGAALGIFQPVAGRIVYGDGRGIWGVNPAAPADPATRVQLTSEAGTPLGWSSDGTQLLFMRGADGAQRLLILHADGSETEVTEPVITIRSATISPDGSRVVFAGEIGRVPGETEGLYVVDADGGPAEMLPARTGMVEEVTFSPDGSRIAYVEGGGDHGHSVWLMDADGDDADQIVSNELTEGPSHVYGLAWSPTGDRIALGLEHSIYTFATDGSDFKRVITIGEHPYWSPDGSQIAYTFRCADPDVCSVGIANADGSNVRTFGFRSVGPWHPGTLVNSPGG